MRFFPIAMMILLAPLVARAEDVSIPPAYPSVESAARLASTRTSLDRAAADRATLDRAWAERSAWKRSLIPLVASQGLDAASSWGRRELNPLLADPNGAFGGKAVTVKFGATAALIGIEYLLVKKFPRSARVFSKMNWAGAVVTTGFAVHNYSIR